ncbi:hypothetical protein [Mycolicibacterium neoaurum]|uniref:hypothetical protein n=1 Tax=Mycolicibacterium neoaurum TaxID=1795 RepID=UPI001F4CEA58|nr:hypothetical protein [Mycolicibacterium neoaurum]
MPVPVATSTDGVTWVEVGAMHHQALCTCKWVGPRRVIFRRPAAVDALLHAAKNGCLPAAPLRRTTVLRPHAAHAA